MTNWFWSISETRADILDDVPHTAFRIDEYGNEIPVADTEPAFILPPEYRHLTVGPDPNDKHANYIDPEEPHIIHRYNETLDTWNTMDLSPRGIQASIKQYHNIIKALKILAAVVAVAVMVTITVLTVNLLRKDHIFIVRDASTGQVFIPAN